MQFIFVVFSKKICYHYGMNNDLLNIFDHLKMKIEEAQFVRVWPFWSDIVAFYPYNRLYLITDGYANLYLKDKTILLKPDHLYFIPQHTVVKGECDIFGHYYCHFEIEAPFSDITNFVHFSEEVPADKEDRALFEKIIRNFPCDTPQKLFTVHGAFQLLFSKLLDQTAYIDTEKTRFIPVLKYINMNYQKSISLDDLAGVMSLNTGYFCSLFKKTFQVSPWQYVINTRLNKASLLLADNEKSIREISFSVGFEDEFYFSRYFKKKFGISPLAYRNKSKMLQRYSDQLEQ